MTTNNWNLNIGLVYTAVVMICTGLIKLWVMIHGNKQKTEENKALIIQHIESLKEDLAELKAKVNLNKKEDRHVEGRVNEIAQAVRVVETKLEFIQKAVEKT